MTAPAERSKSVFLQAVEMASAEERRAFLDAACGEDAALRQEVEELLRHHEELGVFLEAPAAAPLGTSAFEPEQNPAARGGTHAPEATGTVIGPYKLLEQIGEGGMGTVWMAQQTRPVKRQVALKVIKPGMDSRQVLARFEAERQALALMDHPNIAKVLDGGTTDTGRPYFVMELVKGVPITRYCDEHRLPPRQRLELMLPVCQAVQHAHQKGIIHRDLKPSNVLVALYDGVPVPKVIDFGIAKATGQQLTEHTLATGLGAVVGTLGYMSPEQAELNQPDIDTRSDVYSLGVLLYELLTGTTPLEQKRLKQAAILEVLRLIREEEPPRPSTRLSTTDELPSLAANRGLEPRQLSGVVRGELDWIVMRSLEKDRNRRYETANGLAQDIQRYLADEPVLACPPSAGYRLRKFARRNKAALVTAVLIMLALAAGVAGLTVGLLHARASAEAERNARAAERKTRDELDAARDEKDQQRAHVNRELTNALVEATRLREKARSTLLGDAGPWSQLRESLRAAQTLAGNELADPALVGRFQTLSAEVKRDENDRRMAARLDEIRVSSNTYGSDARGKLVDTYEAVFEEYGMTLKHWVLPKEELERRIAASPNRDSLLAALDEMAGYSQAGAKGWMPIALAAANDPWRRRYFEARLRGDWPAVFALIKEPAALDQPPVTIMTLAKVVGERSPIMARESIELLRRAQRRYPADPWINYHLAQRLYWSKANSSLEWRIQIEESVAFARAAVAAMPQVPVVRLLLGHCLIGANHYEDALDVLQGLARVQPNCPGVYYRIGLAHFGRGEWQKAIESDTKEIERIQTSALKLTPDELPFLGRCYYERANAHHNLGQLNQALDDFTRAIDLINQAKAYPLDFSLYYRYRAHVYEKLGQWDKARADYAKRVEGYPNIAEGWYELARAEQRLGKWPEALAAYDRAVRIARNPSWVDDLAWFLATCPDVKVRDPGRAVQLAREVVDNVRPPVAHYWQTLGVALYRSGSSEAAAVLTKAIELHKGEDARDWLFLAIAQKKLGKPDEARRSYDRAVRWIEANKAALEMDPPRANELRCFRAEAEEVLQLKQK
jgi:serine/threonine protein kinase/tetratricopeptide (TPR) repeat protein